MTEEDEFIDSIEEVPTIISKRTMFLQDMMDDMLITFGEEPIHFETPEDVLAIQ